MKNFFYWKFYNISPDKDRPKKVVHSHMNTEIRQKHMMNPESKNKSNVAKNEKSTSFIYSFNFSLRSEKIMNPQMSVLFCIHENHRAFFRIWLQRSLLGIRMKKWSHWRSSLRRRDTDYLCMAWLLGLREWNKKIILITKIEA